jgi:hypothetical protein
MNDIETIGLSILALLGTGVSVFFLKIAVSKTKTTLDDKFLNYFIESRISERAQERLNARKTKQ